MPDLFHDSSLIPASFEAWFETRGWMIHPHQVAMVEADRDGRSALLVAPTGTGKTMAGFLPSLIELSAPDAEDSLHTIYISPLKALAVDIERNLAIPIREMGLDIRAETRTGDTPQAKRKRQRENPPQVLMTTPESLEMMLTWPDAATIFKGVRRVVLDELHALAGNKRGDLLSLSLSRLRRLAPGMRVVGLSATVANPVALRGWLNPDVEQVAVIRASAGIEPEISVLTRDAELPWSGHSASWAVEDIFRLIEANRTTLVFVNTRAQAEILFQSLTSKK